MPSVRAIATQLNLSPATVSRVLNNHPDVEETTRERVLARINEIGYVPRFGRRLTNVIALAYPDEPVRNEYGSFEPALLSGIMRGLGEHHFDLKLLSIRRDKSPDRELHAVFHAQEHSRRRAAVLPAQSRDDHEHRRGAIPEHRDLGTVRRARGELHPGRLVSEQPPGDRAPARARPSAHRPGDAQRAGQRSRRSAAAPMSTRWVPRASRSICRW